MCMQFAFTNYAKSFVAGKFNFLIVGNSRNSVHWILSLSNTFTMKSCKAWTRYNINVYMCIYNISAIVNFSAEHQELTKWIENGKAANCKRQMCRCHWIAISFRPYTTILTHFLWMHWLPFEMQIFTRTEEETKKIIKERCNFPSIKIRMLYSAKYVCG